MPLTVLQHVREVKTALPRRIVDGDTWWCYVDLDYRHLGYFEFRLAGWDTPEKQGPLTTAFERDMARQATEAVIDWWAEEIHDGHKRILIESSPDPEKYGRWLATLWSETPAGARSYLGPHLASMDLAVPTNGTAKWRDTHHLT